PSGQRTTLRGRSATWGSIRSETAIKYWARSRFVIPDSLSRIFSGWVMGRSVLAGGGLAVVLELLEVAIAVSSWELDFGSGSEASAISRTTSFAGLSSRRPLNDAWRTRLSRVHVAKEIWATSSGLTQCTPRETPFGKSENGVDDCTSLSSCLRMVCWDFCVKPVPERPA